MRFFYGLLGIGVGFLCIRYSIQLTEWLGKMDWAEKYLRTGLAGTYTMYRLLGLIIIIFSFLYMFGSLGFITNPLGPLFGGVK